MGVGLLLIAAALLTSGCCWFSKRDCYPACPDMRTVVTVERPCQLPPALQLEGVTRMTTGCPEKAVCFNISNAGKLAKNLAELKDWIREVRRRCTPPASQPTSRPAP